MLYPLTVDPFVIKPLRELVDGTGKEGGLGGETFLETRKESSKLVSISPMNFLDPRLRSIKTIQIRYLYKQNYIKCQPKMKL